MHDLSAVVGWQPECEPSENPGYISLQKYAFPKEVAAGKKICSTWDLWCPNLPAPAAEKKKKKKKDDLGRAKPYIKGIENLSVKKHSFSISF